MKAAIRRANMAKAADEIGLTAELLEYLRQDICNDLLQLFNDMLFSGEVPPTWRKTETSNNNGPQTNREHSLVIENCCIVIYFWPNRGHIGI